MTDYAKWDKFADDISDDDKPRTELKLPKARAHSARAFPGRLIACVENCVGINQCVGCTRQHFTKSFRGGRAGSVER